MEVKEEEIHEVKEEEIHEIKEGEEEEFQHVLKADLLALKEQYEKKIRRRTEKLRLKTAFKFFLKDCIDIDYIQAYHNVEEKHGKIWAYAFLRCIYILPYAEPLFVNCLKNVLIDVYTIDYIRLLEIESTKVLRRLENLKNRYLMATREFWRDVDERTRLEETDEMHHMQHCLQALHRIH